MVRRRLCTAIAAASLARPAIAQGLTIDALMSELARGTEATVDFRETRHSALLRTPIETTGVLRYRRPGFLEKWVKAPHEERYTIDGDRLSVRRAKDGEARSVSLQSQPVLWALVEGIRATLRGDATSLRRFYRLELEGNAGAWTLHLLPVGLDMAEFVRVVRMSGGAGRLRGMEIVETSGDRSVIVFTEALR